MLLPNTLVVDIGKLMLMEEMKKNGIGDIKVKLKLKEQLKISQILS